MRASARPRRRTVVATFIVAAVLGYGTVVALYAAGEASRIGGACEPTPGAVALEVSAESVDAVRDRIAITLEFSDGGPLAIDGPGFVDPVTLLVSGTDGDRSYTIPAQTPPSTITLSLVSDGRVEQWPFDAHVAAPRFALLQTVDGVSRGYVPTICAGGQVSGWALTAEGSAGAEDFVIDDEAVPFVVITATRSSATVTFGLVILLLMTVLPALGLTVAIAAFRGRRKVEATLMSWMAAMLFAVIPLRGFLPGSPPVGSWVDYLVVLWVVGGLVAGLVVYVLAWLKWAPAAGERPSR